MKYRQRASIVTIGTHVGIDDDRNGNPTGTLLRQRDRQTQEKCLKRRDRYFRST